jgi:Zn-finger protein
MPQIFKVGSYLVYFWVNESDPLEPVHVHVSTGIPSANGTKIWITKSGNCLLCHNKSQIPQRQLRDIMEIIEARNMEIRNKWSDTFGEIHYYC